MAYHVVDSNPVCIVSLLATTGQASMLGTCHSSIVQPRKFAMLCPTDARVRLQTCTTASGLKLFRPGGSSPQGYTRRPAVLFSIRQRKQLLTYAATQSTGEVDAKIKLAVRSL